MAYRPIKEVYSDLAAREGEENFYFSPSNYDLMLGEPGWKVVHEASTGSYEGICAYLLTDETEHRFGILFISYGSCSHCDALQACSNWKDLEDLRDSILNDIHWCSTPADLVRWMEDRDWETQSAYYEQGFKEFKDKAIAYLVTLHFNNPK